MKHDAFWLRTMRDLYAMAHPTPLNAIEQAAVMELRDQWERQGTRDRYWAGTIVLREDGAAVVVPLTIDRVEADAGLYAERGWSESFTLTPDE